jgi:hypothetical protein
VGVAISVELCDLETGPVMVAGGVAAPVQWGVLRFDDDSRKIPIHDNSLGSAAAADVAAPEADAMVPDVEVVGEISAET